MQDLEPFSVYPFIQSGAKHALQLLLAEKGGPSYGGQADKYKESDR